MQDPCPVGLRGIVPSLNRPFTEDDAADIDHVRRLLEWTVEAGSAGMLILAVAGEGQSLAREEFRAFAETVVDHNAGRIPVILSVTSAVRAERSSPSRTSTSMSASASSSTCVAPR